MLNSKFSVFLNCRLQDKKFKDKINKKMFDNWKHQQNGYLFEKSRKRFKRRFVYQRFKL